MKNISVVYVIGPKPSGESGILRKISDMERRSSFRKPRAIPTVNPIAAVTPVVGQPAQKQTFQIVTPTTYYSILPLIFRTVVSEHSRDDIPPPDYLCQRCFVLGHFEEYCPTSNDPDWTSKMRKWGVGQI